MTVCRITGKIIRTTIAITYAQLLSAVLTILGSSFCVFNQSINQLIKFISDRNVHRTQVNNKSNKSNESGKKEKQK